MLSDRLLFLTKKLVPKLLILLYPVLSKRFKGKSIRILMVNENKQKNKQEQWKKKVKDNPKREAVKNIIAKTGDLA
ncbi:hypothetical protein [Peribacillus simplex]|uniref:hypothetical protein n=1 Tax=Peribacillus simplex TaxID=1478 RepID=UPI00366BC2B7